MRNLYYVTVGNYEDIGKYAMVLAKAEGEALHFANCEKVYPFTTRKKAEEVAESFNIAFRKEIAG